MRSPAQGSQLHASRQRSRSFWLSSFWVMPHAQTMLHMHALPPLRGIAHSGLPQLKTEATRTTRTASALRMISVELKGIEPTTF